MDFAFSMSRTHEIFVEICALVAFCYDFYRISLVTLMVNYYYFDFGVLRQKKRRAKLAQITLRSCQSKIEEEEEECSRRRVATVDPMSHQFFRKTTMFTLALHEVRFFLHNGAFA